MLKKISIVLLVAVAGLLIAAAMQPAEFSLSRKVIIAAAPDVPFELVNDFHKWEAWSPWAKLDPAMKTTYEGKTGSVGSSYHWSGDSKVGEGKMTIAATSSPSSIKINLEFIKPFPSSNLTEFSFKPEGKETSVTWSMSGKHTFTSKIMSVFTSMDKMVGPDFEKGLAQLKSVSEAKKK